MKVKQVTIQGFHNVDKVTYDFEKLTYFIGHNAAGKTTALQAVQLGILGYIPGTGKGNKTSIFRHCNGNTMSINLLLDDDGEDIEIIRTWAKVGSNIVSGVEIIPEGYQINSIVSDFELPVFNFSEFMNLSSNKMKDWFIDFLPNIEVDIDWKSEMQSVLSPESESLDKFTASVLDESLNHIESITSSGIDCVRDVNKYFKNAVSFKKKELDRCKNGIQQLVLYEDIDDDVSEESILNNISKLEEDINNIKVYRSIQDLYTSTESTLKELEEDLNEDVESDDSIRLYNSQLSDYEQELEILQNDYKRLNSERDSLLYSSSLKEKLMSTGGCCPITSESCEFISSRLGGIESELKEENRLFEDVSQRLDKTRKRLDFVNNKMIQIPNLINERKLLYQSRDQLKIKLYSISIPDIPDNINEEDIVVQIKELKQQLVKIRANQEYNRTIQAFTEQKYRIEVELKAYKSLEKLTGVNGLQSKFNNSDCSPFVKFSNQMDKYLTQLFGESVECSFNLSEKANSFNFGIKRNNKHIPYDLLSSGEKCMYMLSLFICIVSDSNSKLKLILVDDLFDHLDDSNIVKLFNQLIDVPNIQLILAGVKNINIDKKYIVNLGGI